MKKTEQNKMQNISGGVIKCGTVGALVAVAMGAFLLSPIAVVEAIYGGRNSIRGCLADA